MPLSDLLLKQAEKHGFPLSGVLDLDSVLGSEFKNHVGRYDHWLSNEREGEMAYLRRGRDRRADPRLVFPEAQSILCVAVPYWRQPLGVPPQGPQYARYLKGKDYHDLIPARLEALMKDVQSKYDQGLKWKVCVDTSAVLERSWAALAGLGWIGKNTTLIHPKLGSYLFLGEVLINTKVNRGPNPLPNYCGNCTRCLSACPTEAFTEAGTLDSRRCISYWTLEKRGDLGITDSDKKKMGTWVAGCDICQEVCPFNMKPSREVLPPVLPSHSAPDATALKGWLDLITETPDAYRVRVEESALNRVKPGQFSRNLAIALRNFLETGGANEALRVAILNRIQNEEDPVAKAEWERCLYPFDPNLSP